MKKIFFLFLLFPVSLMSQNKADSTNYSMRDSLEILTKRIERLESIVNKKYSDPAENFKDKIIGFEINPGFLMFGNISGGIQLYSIDKMAEISIPFYYFNRNNNYRNQNYFLFSESDENGFFDVDIQYRKFLNKVRTGLWACLGLKYTHVEYNGNYYSYNHNDKYNSKSKDYYGLVFGAGYRTYSSSGFYYGISFTTGRYFSLRMEDDRTKRLILNFEFMKLGYAF